MKTTYAPINKRRVIYIAIGWVLLSWVQVFYDYLVVLNFVSPQIDYPLWQLLFSNGLVALIAGTITGIFLTKLNLWIRSHLFWKAMLSILSIYILGSIVFIGFGSFCYQVMTKQLSPFHPTILKEVATFMTGPDFFKHFISWGLILFITMIILEINDKYGQGNFRYMLTGRYFQPVEEERIFLFMDLKGSTTIAEQLGPKRYFQFLQDFINDATPPILQTKGRIYQYVGDEIIINWKMDTGLQDANCVQCFFKVQETIRARRNHYYQNYQLLPQFKAGVHCGKVMAGEIGVVKKEITFSGDVLNTASRIQNECNKHGVLLLLSEKLLNLLPLPASMETKAIGNIELRGKQEKVNLFTIYS